MRDQKPIRVLWLLNHTTLRRFETNQLRDLGITEIFCPKSFPFEESNLSASIDAALDTSLSIPEMDLKLLNSQNWYGSPSEDAWRIANQYFDIAFIGFFPQQIASFTRNFIGAIVLRVFGLAKGYSYTQLLADELGATFIEKLRSLRERFWFGAGYETLKEEEGLFFKKRNCFLPVGLEGNPAPGAWRGNDKRIFFVCPRIETSPYFQSIYKSFIRDFSGFNYLIGGAQPLRVNDSNVLGFVPGEVHERNMSELRVMFYHSTEPNHIHYHPFEAIRSGMPLVFMAGGMLDNFGGKNLPGRCKTIKEARSKIGRILNDDWGLIKSICKSQVALLEPMRPQNCSAAWNAGLQRIIDSLELSKSMITAAPSHKFRIAVIVPVRYRGGSLRGAKLLAQAIELGSQQAASPVEVVIGHIDDPAVYTVDEFVDLPTSIKRRPYKWQTLDQKEAYQAMVYAGVERPMNEPIYQVPNDGIKQFTDCDLWIVVSDRLERPLLPIRPYVLMVYDYLQRYVDFLPQELNQKFIRAAHMAERVFVTTEFTKRDAIHYAGLPSRKVQRLPMLAPDFIGRRVPEIIADRSPYFLWTTNQALHKNHENALNALRLYYEELDGKLTCRVTGVDTKTIFKSKLPHLKSLKQILDSSGLLRRQLEVMGELSDEAYLAVLSGAEFLWHAGRVDNGTFSVIEAAHLGVPSLSSNYPAMGEIDAQFSLNLMWMDANNPHDMARQLKYMENEAQTLRARLPTHEQLASQSIEKLANVYWQAVRDCL